MKKTTWFIIGFLTAINITAFAASSFNDEGQFADWNRTAINKMQNNGLITGYSDGRFGVNDYVTRGQLAVILDRFADKIVGKKLSGSAVQPAVQNKQKNEWIVSIDDDAIKGLSTAPVTIIEFSEYQCPFCKRYVDNTYRQIVSNYVDTGKVRYVFRDFPLNFHQHSKNAAMAAECAREQGGDEMYWAYHDTLFETGELDTDSLRQHALNLSLNSSNFNTCLDNQKYKSEVEKDLADGQKAGVRGTPSFLINGKLLVGAQPYSAFEAMIEKELNK